MKELLALEANKTWNLVPAPKGASVIGNKWIYSVKVHSDGSLDRYKNGINYEETFAPVAKMTTVRTLLCVAIAHN